MNILITGAAVLVGSEVYMKLKDLKHELFGTSTGDNQNHIIQIDLSSSHQIERKLKTLKLDVFIHCASRLPISINPENSTAINMFFTPQLN